MIVAEDVENKEIVDFLAKSECDILQPFYYSRPITYNEIKQHLLNCDDDFDMEASAYKGE